MHNNWGRTETQKKKKKIKKYSLSVFNSERSEIFWHFSLNNEIKKQLKRIIYTRKRQPLVQRSEKNTEIYIEKQEHTKRNEKFSYKNAYQSNIRRILIWIIFVLNNIRFCSFMWEYIWALSILQLKFYEC